MNTPRDHWTGGCLCGALRWEARGAPRFAGLCFCQDCRKASGSGFAPYIGFDSAKVRFSGPATRFASPAANGGEAVRNFCPACGALVFGGVVGESSFHTVYAGTLDDPTGFVPTAAIFTRGRPDWAVIPPGLAVHERAPTPG